MLSRNMPIKNKVIEYKDEGGTWKPYISSADHDGGQVNQQHKHEHVVASSPALDSPTATDDSVSGHLLLLPSAAFTNSTVTKTETAVSVDEREMSAVTASNPQLCDNGIILSEMSNDISVDTSIQTRKLIDIKEDEDVDDGKSLSYEVNDPAIFANKRITPAIISLLINSPCQPDIDYYFEKTAGRSFLCEWFRIAQPDKTWKNRMWLSYSKSTNSAFCTTCLLFGGPTADNMWTHLGYKGWESGHGLRGIERHEASTQHRQTELIRFQWVHENRVDQPLVFANKLIVEQNRRVMYIAVKTMKFLSTEMMAVLGHTNRDGKFLHLFREFSEFDTCASGYLRQLDAIRQRDVRNKPEVNFLSPLNCRRLLLTMKTLIVRQICSEISQQKAFFFNKRRNTRPVKERCTSCAGPVCFNYWWKHSTC